MAFAAKNKKGKVKGNALLTGFSGMVGGTFVLKQYKDKVVMSNVPDMSNVKFSAEQKKSQSLMAEATAYAKGVLKDPKDSARYAKNLNGKRNVFQAAVSDFLRRGKKG